MSTKMAVTSKVLYDLVVIGAGSGGLECAWNSAELYKRRVAVIDTALHHGIPPFYSALGGTCVNVGCVPKKLFVTGAVHREYLKDAPGFGWEMPSKKTLADIKPNWKTLLKNKNEAVLNINKSYEEMFKNDENLTLHLGFGRIAANNVVEVVNTSSNEVVETLETKNILIATGSWPYNPPFPGIEHTITSNEAFYLEDCPKRVLIIGGGYIAVEFASIFNAYKPEEGFVDLAYRGELFLRGFDTCLRDELASQMRANGVNLMFKHNPSRIEKNADGSKKVTFENGKIADYDVVMVATGRRPKTSGLGLEKVGIKTKEGGGIVVDKGNSTSVANIFAIGDVIDKILLTPVAINEGRCLSARIFNNEELYPNYDNIASAIFSIPHCGTCGLTEEDAAKKYPNISIYKTSFLPLMHQLTGAKHKKNMFKIIANSDTDEIIGVHLVGMETPETIQIISIAMKMGVKMKDFYTTIGVHPTCSEDLTSMRTPTYTYNNHVKVLSSSL